MIEQFVLNVQPSGNTSLQFLEAILAHLKL